MYYVTTDVAYGGLQERIKSFPPDTDSAQLIPKTTGSSLMFQTKKLVMKITTFRFPTQAKTKIHSTTRSTLHANTLIQTNKYSSIVLRVSLEASLSSPPHSPLNKTNPTKTSNKQFSKNAELQQKHHSSSSKDSAETYLQTYK